MSTTAAHWKKLGLLLGLDETAAAEVAGASQDMDAFYEKYEQELYLEGYDADMLEIEALRFALDKAHRAVILQWDAGVDKTYAALQDHPLVADAGLQFEATVAGKPSQLILAVLDPLTGAGLDVLYLSFDSDSYDFVVVPAADVDEILATARAISAVMRDGELVLRLADHPKM